MNSAQPYKSSLNTKSILALIGAIFVVMLLSAIIEIWIKHKELKAIEKISNECIVDIEVDDVTENIKVSSNCIIKPNILPLPAGKEVIEHTYNGNDSTVTVFDDADKKNEEE